MLLLGDRKKLATVIVDSYNKSKTKARTESGAEKDNTTALDNEGRRLLEALQSQDGDTLVTTLKSFVKSVLDESTDDYHSKEPSEAHEAPEED